MAAAARTGQLLPLLLPLLGLLLTASPATKAAKLCSSTTARSPASVAALYNITLLRPTLFLPITDSDFTLHVERLSPDDPAAAGPLSELEVALVRGPGTLRNAEACTEGPPRAVIEAAASPLRFVYTSPSVEESLQGTLELLIGFLDNGTEVVVSTTAFYDCGCPGPRSACGGCSPCQAACPVGRGRTTSQCTDSQGLSGEVPNCIACPADFFSASNNDEACQPCSPPCFPWQLERTRCTASTDRVCEPTPERAALEALRALLSTPGQSAWAQDQDHCEWVGVACTNGEVENLTLPVLAASAALPASLVNLKQLRSLDASGADQLSGPFPELLTRLTRLAFLDLSGNQLTGSLPPQLLTRALLTLRVVGNLLSGTLFNPQPSLSTLRQAQLHTLDVSDNFLGGVLPALDAIPSLTSLVLLPQKPGLSCDLFASASPSAQPGLTPVSFPSAASRHPTCAWQITVLSAANLSST
jgi:hypothetical protein